MDGVPSISAERVEMPDGSLRKILKIQMSQFEINVLLTGDDVDCLQRVAAAQWNKRKSLRAGLTAGTPTFWSVESGDLTILVGEDDEVWDIAVTLPESCIPTLLTAVAQI